MNTFTKVSAAFALAIGLSSCTSTRRSKSYTPAAPVEKASLAQLSDLLDNDIPDCTVYEIRGNLACGKKWERYDEEKSSAANAMLDRGIKNFYMKVEYSGEGKDGIWITGDVAWDPADNMGVAGVLMGALVTLGGISAGESNAGSTGMETYKSFAASKGQGIAHLHRNEPHGMNQIKVKMHKVGFTEDDALQKGKVVLVTPGTFEKFPKTMSCGALSECTEIIKGEKIPKITLVLNGGSVVVADNQEVQMTKKEL